MDPALRTVNAGRRPLARLRAARLLAPRLLASLVLAPLLAGCSFFEQPIQLRGNRVDREALAQLTPGVQSKQDVIALIGSPTARGTFDDNHWFYISADTRVRIGRSQSLTNQQVVEVTFDDAGKYRGSRRLGENDAQQVAIVERQTPVPGGDMSLLQELFGNIGRFGPGAGGAQAGQQTGLQ